MQHPTQVELHTEDTGAVARIVTIVVIVAALCAFGGYMVYGSGLWNPPVQHDRF